MFNFGGPKAPSITMQELRLIKSPKVIDVREAYEFQSGSFPGAKNVPMSTLLAKPDQYLNKSDTYYLLCQSGARSANTTKQLAKSGYQVINVSGGMNAYRK